VTTAAFPRPAASLYAPPPAPWRSGPELLKIHGDYGSVVDSDGWALFSVFWATLLYNRDPKAEEWARLWKERGYSHIALSPVYGYPGSPIAGMSFTVGAFIELVTYTLNSGFAPVLFLSDVPEQGAMVISIIEALKARGLLPYVICVPAWEPIPTDYYTSKQLSDLLIAMHDAGGDEIVIGVHLQPGRWAMSSNPLEPDDPWQGAEAGCWKSDGGEHVDVFLVQFEHGFTQTTAPDWQNRYSDGVPRMGYGMNGWRVIPICVFETVLYDSYRNQCDEARAREIAAEAEAIAVHNFERPVVVTYGNGAPPDQ